MKLYSEFLLFKQYINPYTVAFSKGWFLVKVKKRVWPTTISSFYWNFLRSVSISEAMALGDNWNTFRMSVMISTSKYLQQFNLILSKSNNSPAAIASMIVCSMQIQLKPTANNMNRHINKIKSIDKCIYS